MTTRTLGKKSQALSQMVKELREAMGLTQEQFAARIGVTVATVNRWEKGRAKPQPLAIRALDSCREEYGLK